MPYNRHAVRWGSAEMAESLLPHIAKLFPQWDKEQEARVLDPFAGNGNTLKALADEWNMVPYAIEKDAGYLENLFEKIAPMNVIHSSIYSATVTPRSIAVGYFYPPYSDNTTQQGEYMMSKFASRWLDKSNGSYMLIAMHRERFSKEMSQWLWRNCQQVDAYYLEEHQDIPMYGSKSNLVLIVAQLGDTPSKADQLKNNGRFAELFKESLKGELNEPVTKTKPILDEEGNLTGTYDVIYCDLVDYVDEEGNVVGRGPKRIQEASFNYVKLADGFLSYVQTGDIPNIRDIEGPVYQWPEKLHRIDRSISFRPRKISDDMLLLAAKTAGIQHSEAYLETLRPLTTEDVLRPIIEPRIRQQGAVITSGALGSSVRVSNEDGTESLIRSSIVRYSDEVANDEFIEDESGRVEKRVTVVQNYPLTTITVLNQDGTVQDITDDEDRTEFIRQRAGDLMRYMREVSPSIWQNENDELFEDFSGVLETVLVRGQDELTKTQKHVIMSITKAFMKQNGALLVGQPGTGKTIMSVAIAHLLREIARWIGFSKRKDRKATGGAAIMPGEVAVVMAPPIVANDEKWVGEFIESIPNATVRVCESYEEINEMHAIADRAKEAADEIREMRRMHVPDSEIPQELVDVANHLIVIILSESTAKSGEGYAHGAWWKPVHSKVTDHETGNRVAVTDMVPYDPVTGLVIARRKDGEYVPLKESDFPLTRSGKATDKLRWSGISNRPPLRDQKKKRYAGGPEILEDARIKQEEADNEYNNKIEQNYWTNPPSREIETAAHVSTFERERIGENGEIERDAFGSPIIDVWKRIRSHLDEARDEIIQQRDRFERMNPDHMPLFQQQRYESSMSNLVGFEAGQEVARRRKAAAPEEIRDNFKADRVVPLPDIAQEWLDQEEYVLGENPDWKEKRPISLVDYIVKVFRGRIAVSIFDEIHQYKNVETERAKAFMKLGNAGNKILGLTGTVFGGEATSVFLILYMISEQVRREFPNPMSSATQRRWYETYGVYETVTEATYLKPNGEVLQTPIFKNKGTREVPGVSPALLALMLNVCIFVNMEDMSDDLPPFTRIPVAIPLDDDERELYVVAEELMMEYQERCELDSDPTFKKSMVVSTASITSCFWRGRDVWHRKTVELGDWTEGIYSSFQTNTPESADFNIYDWHLAEDQPQSRFNVRIQKMVIEIPGFGEERLSSKERWLIRLAEHEISSGRGIMIPVEQTGEYDIQPRLMWLLETFVEGAKPFTLTSSGSARQRANFINEKVLDGHNVIIGNMRKMEVGIDLIKFQTAVLYEKNYSLQGMLQVIRRAYRMNQDQPVRVYIPYHVKTLDPEVLPTLMPVMEHVITNALGRKERAHAFLSGEATTGLGDLAGVRTNIMEEIMDSILSGEFFEEDTNSIFSQAAVGMNVETNLPTFAEDDWNRQYVPVEREQQVVEVEQVVRVERIPILPEEYELVEGESRNLSGPEMRVDLDSFINNPEAYISDSEREELADDVMSFLRGEQEEESEEAYAEADEAVMQELAIEQEEIEPEPISWELIWNAFLSTVPRERRKSVRRAMSAESSANGFSRKRLVEAAIQEGIEVVVENGVRKLGDYTITATEFVYYNYAKSQVA